MSDISLIDNTKTAVFTSLRVFRLFGQGPVDAYSRPVSAAFRGDPFTLHQRRETDLRLLFAVQQVAQQFFDAQQGMLRIPRGFSPHNHLLAMPLPLPEEGITIMETRIIINAICKDY
ncbi:hypothetical protein [Ewingella americana]